MAERDDTAALVRTIAATVVGGADRSERPALLAAVRAALGNERAEQRVGARILTEIDRELCDAQSVARPDFSVLFKDSR